MHLFINISKEAVAKYKHEKLFFFRSFSTLFSLFRHTDKHREVKRDVILVVETSVEKEVIGCRNST